MSCLPHRFDLEALAEYEAAARYYAARQPGLGLRFITCIEDAITLICEAPERWRVFAGGEVRRARTRVFPHSILYTVEPDHVLIVAVAHTAVHQVTGSTACGEPSDQWNAFNSKTSPELTATTNRNTPG